MNLVQLVSAMRSGNPKDVALSFLGQNGGNNPMIKNVMGMINQGDAAGVEAFARNLAKEKGIDPDQAVAQLKSML